MATASLREAIQQLVEQVKQVKRYAARCTIYGPADALRDHISRAHVCADELAALLAVGDRPQHEDTKDDPSRVETPATIPSAGSTAQSATGDTSSRQTTLRDALADLRQLVKTEAGHIAYFDEELDAVVAAALRQGSQAPRNHEDLIAAVIDHWLPVTENP